MVVLDRDASLAGEAARRSGKPGSWTASRESAANRTATPPTSDLLRRAATLLDTELAFIPNDSYVGRRDSANDLSPLAAKVERGEGEDGHQLSAGLPTHLGRMCATPLLKPEEEGELFRRMNFCKYRANALRARLSRTNPDPAKLAEAEEYVARAERLRNYIINANTRLVMSIARKFADARNGFDDLLSQGIASLMHAVEKFDYSRGFRFSTYATCAVRRDLYRQVMSKKKDQQRFSTGTAELLDGCADAEPDPNEMTESGWSHLTESLREMLGDLDERERFIVVYRFGLDESGRKKSYSRLGERLGISKERVRQLANRALAKLRERADELHLEALLA